MRSMRHALTLLSLLGWVTLAAPAWSQQARGGLPGAYALGVERVGGKPYYVTYRVASSERAAAYRNPRDGGRFRGVGIPGQYGDGFYLFSTLADARKFARCNLELAAEALMRSPATPPRLRASIVKVLLPKDQFDGLVKHEITTELDWAVDRSHPRNQERAKLWSASDVLFGRWAEDPQAPVSAYFPMGGAPQLMIVQRFNQGSILDSSVIEPLSEEKQTSARSSRVSVPTTKAPRLKLDSTLPKAERLADYQRRARAQHAPLHQLLEGTTMRSEELLGYLARRFPAEGRLLRQGSGTWEGYSVGTHTATALGILESQLRFVGLDSMRAAYPKINIDRALRLALALHDVGKPVALDKARQIIEGQAAGKAGSADGKKQLRPHHEYSLPLMSRVMWEVGCTPEEIKLARALVSSHALGELARGRTNFTSAARELEAHAAKTGVSPRDYFVLQRLFFAADAGSYPVLKQTLFESRPSGQLVPYDFSFQQLSMRFGVD